MTFNQDLFNFMHDTSYFRCSEIVVQVLKNLKIKMSFIFANNFIYINTSE